MTDRKIEKLFITSCDRIVIALLQRGECTNAALAKIVGLHPVHVSRLLSWLEDYELVESKRLYGRHLGGGIRRVNKLTESGCQMAVLALKRREVLAGQGKS